MAIVPSTLLAELPAIDLRRLLVRVATACVFAIGGVALFALRWQLEGVLIYIAISNIAKLIGAELTTSVVVVNGRIGIGMYRWSPGLIAVGGVLPLLFPGSVPALLLLPVCIGMYVGIWWSLHHDLAQMLGRGTRSFQATEVLGTLVGTVILIAVSTQFTIATAVAVGGVFALAGTAAKVPIDPLALQERIASWSDEARGRADEVVENGKMMARSVAMISFSALSCLRIEALTGNTSILAGIVELGAVLCLAEFVVWLFTGRIPYDDSRLKVAGFSLTVIGFALIAAALNGLSGGSIGPIGVFGLGYVSVALAARSVHRTADQQFARASLRGVENRPGVRERTKFRVYVFLLPLLAAPWILPVVGVLGALMLLRCRFEGPDGAIS